MVRPPRSRGTRDLVVWSLTAAAAGGVLAAAPWLNAWQRMAATIAVTFLGFKLFAIPGRRLLAYLALWPGMDPQPFEKDRAPDRSSIRLAAGAASRIALGVGLLLIPAPLALQGWLFIAAFILIVHLGLFDLLAAAWRAYGLRVEHVSPDPVRSESLAEFWARRWNMAFHVPVREHLYRPIARRFGSTPALIAVFLVSGLLHELVLSFPAGGGWGLPTLYFALHGGLVWLERRGVLRGRRWTTILFVLLPLPLLAHAPFMESVIYPVLLP